MSRNAGKTFLQGFQPNFANTFEMGYRANLLKAEQMRQEQEKLKYQQEQAGILNQLVAGGKRGKIDSLSMGTIPFSPQEQTGLISQADDNTLQRYSLISKLNAPKEQPKKEYLTFGDSVYEKSDGGLKQVLTKESKPGKVWIKDERFGDKMKKLMGYENPEADENDPQTRVVNGKKFTITDYAVNDIWEKKTDGNGQPRVSLKDEIKKSLGDYYKKQQEYLAITNAGFGNKQVDGKENEVTYKEKLNTHNKIYSEAVKNTMSETARGWYDKVYNYQDENKLTGNPDPQDYWTLLREDYVKGRLGKDPNKEDDYEDADFQILTENFKAIYGFDPTQVYGY